MRCLALLLIFHGIQFMKISDNFSTTRYSRCSKYALLIITERLARDWVPAHEKIYSALGMSGFSPFLNNDLIRHSFTIPMTEKYSSMLNVGKITLT